jgi:hypothetical protein
MPQWMVHSSRGLFNFVISATVASPSSEIAFIAICVMTLPSVGCIARRHMPVDCLHNAPDCTVWLLLPTGTPRVNSRAKLELADSRCDQSPAVARPGLL